MKKILTKGIVLITLVACSHRGLNTVKVHHHSQVNTAATVLTSAEIPTLEVAKAARLQTTEVKLNSEPSAATPATPPRQRFDKSKLGKVLKISGGVIMAGGAALFLYGHHSSPDSKVLTLKNILEQMEKTALMMLGLMVVGAGLLIFLLGVLIYRRNTFSTQGHKPLY